MKKANKQKMPAISLISRRPVVASASDSEKLDDYSYCIGVIAFPMGTFGVKGLPHRHHFILCSLKELNTWIIIVDHIHVAYSKAWK